MTMPDAMLADLRRFESDAEAISTAFHMDEEAFRAFYDRTAPALWAYVTRIAGDRQLADDLLQETYYRFLRADAAHESDEHRRAYLFRIATNLVRDGHRRRRTQPVTSGDVDDHPEVAADGGAATRVEQRTDLTRALAQLKPRERALLWLAYAQGSSHREIADALALKASSIKPLLFRARQKLATVLRVSKPHRREPGGAS